MPILVGELSTKTERKATMNRIDKKIVIKSIVSFCFFVITMVLMIHFRSFRGDAPCTWNEIFDDFWLIILISFVAAVIITFNQNSHSEDKG